MWLRGLLPADRVQVPPPAAEESWWDTGFDEGIFQACPGAGSPERPVLLFGGASGGAGTSSPLFRRVGVGLAQFDDEANMHILRTVSGVLPGPQQS
eukprot:3600010-Pyramimonas_sp.AAC.1